MPLEGAIAVEPPVEIPNPFKDQPGARICFDKTKFGLNVHKNKVLANVKRNIRRHLPQLDCYAATPKPIAIVAGGWSLEDTFEELRDFYYAGHPLVALNGAGNWLMERNIRPAMLMVMDARKENLVFVEKPIPRCQYFLASQCDPSLFDACAERDVRIFHALSCGDESREKEILDEYYLSKWRHIPGGGTVGLRAVTLVRMLGYQMVHVFGLDSCLSPEDGANHAYEQDWNQPDKKIFKAVWVAGKRFTCTGWHCAQWHQFKQYLFTNGEHLHLEVHGDGMIAHTLRAGAEAWRSFQEGDV